MEQSQSGKYITESEEARAETIKEFLVCVMQGWYILPLQRDTLDPKSLSLKS